MELDLAGHELPVPAKSKTKTQKASPPERN
jgi:hypothetical protein